MFSMLRDLFGGPATYIFIMAGVFAALLVLMAASAALFGY